MPRIKFVTSVSAPSCAFLKGHVHDATPDMAEAMIRAGNAVAVDAETHAPVNTEAAAPAIPSPKPMIKKVLKTRPALSGSKLVRG